MSALWTAREAAAATAGTADGEWTASGVSIDSRTVAPGDLFIALAGPNFDGHDYVADALAKGAAAAMVHRRPEGVDPARLLVVSATLDGLAALGRAARRRTTAKVIAVTGSCGKTSTKEAIRHGLEAADARVHASAKSFNNHWGVPLTLATMPRDTAFAVIEMGMNHAGELRGLTGIARPDVAVITTVEAAHLAAFPSVEAIADAKAEIFEGLSENGVAVVPADNPWRGRLEAAARAAGAARIVTFGFADDADYRAVKVLERPDRSCVTADLGGVEAAFCLGLPGRHQVSNALAMLAAIDAAGGDIGRAAPSLSQLRPLDGRGARHEIRLRSGTFLLIDESYNANPASVRAALSVLGAAETAARGRRIAVLGDMLELGQDSRALHAALADDVVRAGVDRAMLCGSDMAALAARLEGRVAVDHAESSEALLPAVTRVVRPGDVVLVKGSLGSRMAPIVQALKGLAVPLAACG